MIPKLLIVVMSLLNIATSYAANIDFGNFRDQRHYQIKQPIIEAEEYFTSAADHFKSEADTANYLIAVAHIADVKYRNGEFNNAFELLLDNIEMAKRIDDKLPLIDIHEMLGLLYSTYHKDSLAMSHIKSGLAVAKECLSNSGGDAIKQRVESCYLDVAIQCVAIGDYYDAIKYVDSCYVINANTNRKPYADAVYADAYLKLGDYTKAQEHLRGVAPYMQSIGSGYVSDVYYMEGQLQCAFHPDKSPLLRTIASRLPIADPNRFETLRFDSTKFR